MTASGFEANVDRASGNAKPAGVPETRAWHEPAVPVARAEIAGPHAAGIDRQERSAPPESSAPIAPARPMILQRAWTSPAGLASAWIDLATGMEHGPDLEQGIAAIGNAIVCRSEDLRHLTAPAAFLLDCTVQEIGRAAIDALHRLAAYPCRIVVRLQQDDAIANIGQARLVVGLLRAAGVLVRLSDCGARYFNMVFRDNLAVDQVGIRRFSAIEGNIHSALEWRMATEAIRGSGAILLAEGLDDAGHIPVYGAAGFDLCQTRADHWLPFRPVERLRRDRAADVADGNWCRVPVSDLHLFQRAR